MIGFSPRQPSRRHPGKEPSLFRGSSPEEERVEGAAPAQPQPLPGSEGGPQRSTQPLSAPWLCERPTGLARARPLPPVFTPVQPAPRGARALEIRGLSPESCLGRFTGQVGGGGVGPCLVTGHQVRAGTPGAVPGCPHSGQWRPSLLHWSPSCLWHHSPRVHGFGFCVVSSRAAAILQEPSGQSSGR